MRFPPEERGLSRVEMREMWKGVKVWVRESENMVERGTEDKKIIREMKVLCKLGRKYEKKIGGKRDSGRVKTKIEKEESREKKKERMRISNREIQRERKEGKQQETGDNNGRKRGALEGE